MKTIDQLIQEKRQQVERLNAQLELLEELAREARGSSPRGGRGRGRPSGPGRRRDRAGRGANQQRVLKVLSATPMRARDIAAAAKLPAPAANQVLMGLKKSGAVRQAGRGLYRLTATDGASAPKRSRRRSRSKTRPTGHRRRQRPKARRAKAASRMPSTRQDTISPAKGEQ